jgi:hypothetical protein
VPIGGSNGVDYLYPKSVPFAESAENVDVAGPLPPEPVIVPDEQLAQPKPAAKDELDEIFGREGRELRGKWQDSYIVEARFRENFQLLVIRREEQRCRGWIHDLEGMRLECDENARDLERTGSSDQALDNVTVPTMNTVESSDGYDGAFDVRGQPRLVGWIDPTMHRRRLEVASAAPDRR